jgi:hypothetical protein
MKHAVNMCYIGSNPILPVLVLSLFDLIGTQMKTCSHCHQKVNSNHYCSVTQSTIDYNSLGDFCTSVIVGAVTDNALLGGIVGGDMLGGLIGDFFSDGDIF